jgi:hypothetical protein
MRDLTMPRRRCHSITAMPPSSDDNHRVVSFPRAKVRSTAWSRKPTYNGEAGLLLSLAKFERDDREDDYRHRMIMNTLAFIVLVVLIGIGLWLMARVKT